MIQSGRIPAMAFLTEEFRALAVPRPALVYTGALVGFIKWDPTAYQVG